MLREELIPTPLIRRSEIPPLEVLDIEKPSLFLALSSLATLLGFVKLILALKFQRIGIEEKAEKLRRFIEARGGIWLKIGQLLAHRRDAFAPEYCDELEKLQDRAMGFSADQSRRIIESELGRPIETVFVEFQESPIAAASVSQIHRARLKHEDVWVAVKVLRPHIAEIFQRDLALVRTIIGVMDRMTVLPWMRWSEMYDELDAMLTEEVDLRIEAGSMVGMRKSLRKHRNVYVPSVFLRYCTRQILVIEWIDGVLMSDYIKLLQTDPSKVEAWRRCNDVDPNEVAESLFMTVQRQIHEDNLFHGDLHPGNILLLRDNCIALIDFGSVGTLEKGVRRRLTLYNRLINQGELTRGMAALLALSSPLPSTDLDMLIRKLVRSYQLLTKVTSSPAFSPEERAKSNLATQQARIMREYMVPVCWDFLRITRTGAALDASLRALNSEVDYYRLWRSYLRRRDARELLRRRKNFGEDVWQLFANSRDFNGRRLDDMIARQDVRTMVPMRSPRLLSQICVKLQGAFPFLVLLLLGAFLRQRHSTILPGMVNEFLRRTTDWIPVMSYGMWLLLGVVLVYCHFALKGLANHLRNS